MDKRFLTWKECAVLAALAAGLVVWLLCPRVAGAVAVVERSGEEIGRYPLNMPIRAAVSGANGFYLEVVVEDGAVHVEDATCPDLVCRRHKPVSQAGEAIVCLPGQITVRIEGGEGHGPDAVSG